MQTKVLNESLMPHLLDLCRKILEFKNICRIIHVFSRKKRYIRKKTELYNVVLNFTEVGDRDLQSKRVKTVISYGARTTRSKGHIIWDAIEREMGMNYNGKETLRST